MKEYQRIDWSEALRLAREQPERECDLGLHIHAADDFPVPTHYDREDLRDMAQKGVKDE